MNDKPENANALTTTADGFDLAASDASASPIQGVGMRFKDGGFYAHGDEMDVEGQTFAVIDRRSGWQKLEKDCPPEYVMHLPGAPRPLQPSVPTNEWPLDLNGKPSHPWKWTAFVYLLNTSTGEASTFWSSTIGGSIAVKDLTDQIALMRRMKPGAIPIVALESKDMPTQYGGTKPRPYFKICGWRERNDGNPDRPLLGGPEIKKPTTEEVLNDSLPF